MRGCDEGRVKFLLAAGSLSADALRSVKRGWPDEKIVRWVLPVLGWTFSRRDDAWVRNGGSMSVLGLSLTEVLAVAIGSEGLG